jgi:plastocyanin
MKRFIIFCLVILSFACKKDDEATVVVNASSANSSEGTVQFTPSDYTVGSSITFSATPNTGYIFVNWTDSNSNTKYTNNPLNITANNNINLVATFEKSAYSVNVLVSGEGSVQKDNSSSGSSNFLHGDSIEITASPANNYSFFYWNNDPSDTANPKNVVLDGNVILEAKFEYEVAKKMVGSWEFDIVNNASREKNYLKMTVDLQLNCLMETYVNDDLVSQVFTYIEGIDPTACVIGDFAVMTDLSVVSSQTLSMNMITLPEDVAVPTNISEVKEVIEKGVELKLNGEISTSPAPETDEKGIIIIPTEAVTASDTSVQIVPTFNESFVKLALIQSPTLEIPEMLELTPSFVVTETLKELIQSGIISGSLHNFDPPLVDFLDTIVACKVDAVLSSASGTDNQKLQEGQSMVDLTYNVSVTSSCSQTLILSSTGLPSGVSASLSNNVVTIGGTPSNGEIGLFNFTFFLESGFSGEQVEGSIIVESGQTQSPPADSDTSNSNNQTANACTINVSFTSDNADQSILEGQSIVDMVGQVVTTGCDQTANITTVTNLPNGVTATLKGNTLTVAGTPSSGTVGTFPYTIIIQSGTASEVLDGTIIINQNTQSQNSQTQSDTTQDNSGTSSDTGSISPTVPQGNTYEINVTASSLSNYTLSGSDRNGSVSGNDPVITIASGDTINFNVNSPGHPFYIQTAAGVGAVNLVSGLSNNGTSSGGISWSPSSTGTFYYQCSLHVGMYGTIIVQ